MKRIVLWLFAVCLVQSVEAYDFKVGKLYYNFISTSQHYTVEVTYLKHRSKENYAGLTSVEIPSTVKYKGTTYVVTNIGEFAFFDCASLKSVTIPASVETIEGRAFTGSGIYENGYNWPKGILSINGCLIKANETLTGNYVVKDTIRLISDRAFANCYALTSITIPNTVTVIGKETFANCYGLKSIVLNEHIKSIGMAAFVDCKSLKSITIPSNVKTIGENAFARCISLELVNIPEGITRISRGVFSGCTALQSITLPLSAKGIGEKVFEGCTSLQSVNIPDGVTKLGFKVFSKCTSLSTITIPASVKTLGQLAFEQCTSLQNIVYQGTKSEWEYITKDASWNQDVPCRVVHCIDGDVEID